MSTQKERIDAIRRANAMLELGFDADEYATLRRASMSLRRWAECECNGAIRRDEATNAPYWHSERTGVRVSRAKDRESGALRRIAMVQALHPDVTLSVQGDPRGCALYAVPAHLLADGAEVDSVYSRGVAIY